MSRSNILLSSNPESNFADPLIGSDFIDIYFPTVCQYINDIVLLNIHCNLKDIIGNSLTKRGRNFQTHRIKVTNRLFGGVENIWVTSMHREDWMLTDWFLAYIGSIAMINWNTSRSISKQKVSISFKSDVLEISYGWWDILLQGKNTFNLGFYLDSRVEFCLREFIIVVGFVEALTLNLINMDSAITVSGDNGIIRSTGGGNKLDVILLLNQMLFLHETVVSKCCPVISNN